MVVGVVPFGLVAGAAPVAEGLGPAAAIGLSTIVFAGASQLAVVEILGQGGPALVAILAAWTINLRMVLYSASLAPFLGHESTPRRLGAAYLLVDQVYALAVTRWSSGVDLRQARLPFYVGAGATLWLTWQLATIAGVLVGRAVPATVPLDLAVPLVFLVLLVPVLTTWPAMAAAAAGGGAAVLAAAVGAGPLAIIAGSVMGIAAGSGVDLAVGAARRRTGSAAP